MLQTYRGQFQILKNKSPSMILPFCLSTWVRLIAVLVLCPQRKYREPMEESVLFTLTVIPSKEAQGKGEKSAAAETGDRKD